MSYRRKRRRRREQRQNVVTAPGEGAVAQREEDWPVMSDDAVTQDEDAAQAQADDEASTPASTPESADNLVIREPQSLDDLVALHLLCLMQADEIGQAPANPEKVMRRLIEAAQHPDSNIILLAVKDGRLVGHLLLERRQWDWSDADYLGEYGFYVLPQHRGGDVGPALLRDGRAIAELAGLPLYVAIMNPTRRRGATSHMDRAASLIGFVPQGALLRFGA